MKIAASFTVLLITIISCNNNEKVLKHPLQSNGMDMHIDSLKWLFYAYSFNGVALFGKNQKNYSFNPAECDIKIDNLKTGSNDSLTVNFSFYREGYKYFHVYEGMNIYGFSCYNNITRPLTGMIVLDSIDNISYIKTLNYKLDSSFRIFLKSADTSRLSNWLFKEAKRRNVW
jgi:hypothetical protein